MWSEIFPTRLQWPVIGLITFMSVLLIIFISFIVIKQQSAEPSSAHNEKRDKEKSDKPDADTAVIYDLANDIHGEIAQRYIARYKTATKIAVGSIVLCIIGAIMLIARPSSISPEYKNTSSRDIILCLDVSGSALGYDRNIIAAYSQLVHKLHGERIGLSIFNSTSKTVFPLTDDYTVVNNQLNYAYNLLDHLRDQKSIDAMTDKQYQEVNDWLDGTQNIENSTSLIGNGLVSCTMMLPQLNNSDAQKARSASIILATDNIPSGKQTFTLSEALNIAHQSNINVDALYIGSDKTSQSDNALSMKEEIEKHGGTYVDLNSSDTIDDIVRDVLSTKSGIEIHEDTSNVVDNPVLIVLVILIAFIVFVCVAERILR